MNFVHVLRLPSSRKELDTQQKSSVFPMFLVGKLIKPSIFGIIWWEKMWSSVVPFLPSSCFFRGKWVEILQSDPWKSIGNFSTEPHDSGRTGRFGIWMFPKIMVPPNGWFIMEILINMDDLGVPSFLETTIWYIWKVRFPLWFSTGEEMQRLARWALEEQRWGPRDWEVRKV